MQIVPKDMESSEFWGSLPPGVFTFYLAGLAEAINQWGDGIEVAGSAKQMRYPGYVEPSAELAEVESD